MCRLIRVFVVSVPLSFTFVFVPSTFAQTWISAVTATTTTTSATISWTTAVPANSQITYGTTTSYGNSSALNSNLVTTHSITLTALNPGTTYHYRVLSADSSGVLVTALDNVFTTPALISVSISPMTSTVVSGGTQQFSAQVTNTNNTAVTWSAASGTVSTSGLFTAPTVTATKTVTVTATSVADTSKSASATVTVNAPAGILTLNPTSINFGSVTVGQTSPVLTTTLTNTGNASLTITSDSLSAGDFSWGGKGTCNYNTLSPGSSCTYSAKFTPTTTGTRTATITINSTASNSTVTLPLSGTGMTATAGTLSVSPATLNVGSVVVGSSGTGSGSLTATGATVTVTAVSSNNSQFVISGLSLPVAIPAGQSVPYTITFSPTAATTDNATLTFTSNAQPTTTTEPLTGIGTAAPTHSVSLSWNASTSQNINGYNIYRAVYTSSCGAFAKINSLLNTGLLYTDSNVANGTSYCYATTAVNTSNVESGYSNVVSNVQVPAS